MTAAVSYRQLRPPRLDPRGSDGPIKRIVDVASDNGLDYEDE